MKKVYLSSITLFALVIFILSAQTSCKKENVTNVTRTDTVYKCVPNIQGLWIGTQQNATSGQAFSMSIKADGTMFYENVITGTQQLCVGTWTLVSGVFSCTTTCVYGLSGNIGVRQTFTANYNSTTGALSNGTYVNLSPSSGSGTFTLTEVN